MSACFYFALNLVRVSLCLIRFVFTTNNSDASLVKNFPCIFILEDLVGTVIHYVNSCVTSCSPADRKDFWTAYDKSVAETVPQNITVLIRLLTSLQY
jgi:hypothetical protein